MWAAPGPHGATERDSRQPLASPRKPGPKNRPKKTGPRKPAQENPDQENCAQARLAQHASAAGPYKPDPTLTHASLTHASLAVQGLRGGWRASPAIAKHTAAALALVGIGKEQLLTVDFVSADRFLPFAGDEPVNEGLAQILPSRLGAWQD